MSVELLQTLSLISYLLAGILFLVAVALFFLLQVPKLFGDITGSNARKAIENIRQQNESTGDKAYKPSKVNAQRGKVTDKMTASGKLAPPRDTGMGVSMQTAKLKGMPAEATTVLQPAEETTLLGSNETTVLQPETTGNETTVLSQPAPTAAETTLLTPSMPSGGETTVLSPADLPAAPAPTPTYVGGVTVDAEYRFAGTAELIE